MGGESTFAWAANSKDGTGRSPSGVFNRRSARSKRESGDRRWKTWIPRRPTRYFTSSRPSGSTVRQSGQAPSTVRNYSHVLSRYLLPEFKDQRLTEITHEAVRRWRDRLRQEADRLQVANENGVTLLDRRGKAIRPFGASTINEALRLLGQILERAVESEHYAVQRNPVKGRTGLRLKKRGGSPRRHLEADEVLSLIQAADTVDAGVTPRSLVRADRARALRAHGLTWSQVADDLGCAETTAIYLSRVRPNRGRHGDAER